MLTYPVHRASYFWESNQGTIDVIVSGVTDPTVGGGSVMTYDSEEALVTDDGDTSYLRFTSGPTTVITWHGWLDQPPVYPRGATIPSARMVFVYRCTADWPVVVTMATSASGTVPATGASNNLTLPSTGGAWATYTWTLPTQFYIDGASTVAPLRESTLNWSALISQTPFPSDYMMGAVEVTIARGTSGAAQIDFTHMRVEIDTGQAALRHRNRDDGLANSMARKGPKGPTSSQLSARRGPRAYS